LKILPLQFSTLTRPNNAPAPVFLTPAFLLVMNAPQQQCKPADTQAAPFYQALVTHSTELISVINEEGVYSYVGSSVKQQLGYEVEEMLGTCAISYIHPDDAACAAKVLGDIHLLQDVQMKPFRFKAKSGEWRWMQCTITNMLENKYVQGIVTNSKDVTEVVEAESRKDYHLAYYEALFFEHPDAVFTLDSRGNINRVNSHVSLITGYAEADILGCHFSILLHPDHAQLAEEAFREALAGKALHRKLPILSRLGEEKMLFLTLIPVHIQGEAVGIQGIAQDITASLQAQQLLKDQANQLHNIVESIPDPFYVLDSAWRFEHANAAYLNFLGTAREHIAGKNIWELYPFAATTGFYEKCLEVAANRTTVYFEETYPGHRFETLKFTIFPADSGIAVHFVDYTAQKLTQLELEKLSLVASKTINGVVIMNNKGCIDWVNDGFCRITGYTREEVAGLAPSLLLQGPDTDPEAARRIQEKYRLQQPFSSEILNYKKNGQKFWFAIDVAPIFDAQGELVNYIAVQTDITERKESEAKLLTLTDDLLKHNRNLQQFAYIVSHNLRAPVANALGLAALLKKLDKHSAFYDKSMEKLQVSVHQLDTVIKDISNILTTREAGGMETRKQVSLLEVCQEVLQSFEEQLQEIGAQVQLEIDSSIQMLSIKAYLYSILYNLISNAIKFRATERPLSLHVAVAKDARGYVLTFSDNGLGMDMRQVEHQLFKLYNRFHTDIQGKGMGLYMLKTQVEALGGKVKVESKLGAGTTFTLFLGAKHV